MNAQYFITHLYNKSDTRQVILLIRNHPRQIILVTRLDYKNL